MTDFLLCRISRATTARHVCAWGSADRAELRTDCDGATVRLFWNDGAALAQFYDTKAEAEATLARLGFGRSRSAK